MIWEMFGARLAKTQHAVLLLHLSQCMRIRIYIIFLFYLHPLPSQANPLFIFWSRFEPLYATDTKPATTTACIEYLVTRALLKKRQYLKLLQIARR
jgi:hypothetical protein